MFLAKSSESSTIECGILVVKEQFYHIKPLYSDSEHPQGYV